MFIDGRMDKEVVRYIYNEIQYYSASEKNGEFLAFATIWMDLEGIRLRKTNTVCYHIYIYIYIYICTHTHTHIYMESKQKQK